MKCEYNYCIYNSSYECLLNDIQINALGMCENCIIVGLEEKFLELEKGRQLHEIEMRWINETE